MYKGFFGIEGFVDYHSGWLRVGRRWFGFWQGRPRILPVFSGGGKSYTVQRSPWAFGDDDGSESGHSLDTEAANRTSQAADTPFLIRFGIAETAGGTSNSGYVLEAQKNGTGGYAEITTSSTGGLRIANDTQSRSDDESTTERLTAGGGTFVAGKYDDGQTQQGTTAIVMSSQYSEMEFCIEIDSANASDGDYWDLQIAFTGGTDLDAYNGTPPRVTANIPPTLTAEQGSFSVTGQDVQMARGQILHITFEGGTTGEFDSVTGTVTVDAASAQVGSYGANVSHAGDAADHHGNNNFTIQTNAIRFRIYFEDVSLAMTAGDNAELVAISADGTVSGNTEICRLVYQDVGGTESWNFWIENDAGTTDTTGSFARGSSGYVECVVYRASSAVAADGSAQIWVGGVSQGTATNIDNYDTFATITGSRIGGDSGDAGTTGVIRFDDFIVRDDDTLIGPASANPDPLTAEQGSFTLSGQITLLEASRLLAMGQGSFTLAGQVVLFELTKSILAEQGSFTLTGQDVGLVKTWTALAAEQGSFVLSGQDAAIAKTVTMAADQGSFTWTGQDVGLLASRLLAMEQGSITLTGQDTGLIHQFPALTAEQGSITLTGQDVLFQLTKYVGAGQGSFVLAGQDVTLSKIGAYELIAEQGSFVLSGQVVGLLASRIIAANQGSITLTGQDVQLAKVFAMAAEQGSLTWTGQDASLVVSRLLTADQGSFVLSGQDVSLIYTGSYSIIAEQGSFTWTGQTALLLASRSLAAGQGSITWTGQDAGLLASRLLTASQGSFTLTGQDATIAVSIVKLVLEQTSYIVQVVEQTSYIVQVVEQDANIVQVVEQTSVLKGSYET